MGANAAVDRFGHFEWKSVNPGSYLVQVVGGDGQGFFLKSATMGGQDIAAGFTASGPAELDLVVSTKGGIIEGVVVEREKNVDNNYPVANATVVAVPEEKYRKLPDRFLTGETDQHGRFTLRAWQLYTLRLAGRGRRRLPGSQLSKISGSQRYGGESGGRLRLEV